MDPRQRALPHKKKSVGLSKSCKVVAKMSDCRQESDEEEIAENSSEIPWCPDDDDIQKLMMTSSDLSTGSDEDEEEFNQRLQQSLEEYSQRMEEISHFIKTNFRADVGKNEMGEEEEREMVEKFGGLETNYRNFDEPLQNVREGGREDNVIKNLEDLEEAGGYTPPECRTIPDLNPRTAFEWRLEELRGDRTVEGPFFETRNEAYVFRPELVLGERLGVGFWIHRARADITWPRQLKVRLDNPAKTESVQAEVPLHDSPFSDGVNVLDGDSGFYLVDNLASPGTFLDHDGLTLKFEVEL